MSQLSQHNDASAHANTLAHAHAHDANANFNSNSRLQFFLQATPTIERSQFYPPNNSTPRAEPGKRSLRKAAPSPLQTSLTATSTPTSVTPTRPACPRVGVDPSSSLTTIHQSSPPSPRSPKERLDDLLAPEQSFYRSKDSSVEPNQEDNKARYPQPMHDSNGPSRSVSDPVVISKPSGGPSSSKRPLMASAHRIEMARGPPRTSSIDSAISSISGGTHSKKGSLDMQTGAPPDIANLIQAAGSPEAVIQYLLKEKASQASQNAQLWRLVDKQRALILGLNRDLERALKDKERYRKKLKESLAPISNPSPVDSTHGVGSEAGSTSSDTRPAEVKTDNVGSIVSAGLREPEQDRPPSPIDVALAPYPITPPGMMSIQIPGMLNMIEAEHRMPSPSQHAFQQYNPDAPGPGFEAGQQQRKANEVAMEIPYNASLPPSRSVPSKPPRGPPPGVPPPKAPMSSQGPSVKPTEPSPHSDEGLRSFPTPPRKAPPAPLNLGKKNNASSHLRQASGSLDESDSDYDDILEVDELPTLTNERGRRRTREEDDKERETAAIKDAEMRSRSKRSGQTTPKSRPTTPKGDLMPKSPRQAVHISPPNAHLRHESNVGSLAGILDEASGIVLPLLSPGLPMSPRPIDRPAGSPTPRSASNHSSAALNSPPMSPRRMGAFPGPVPLSPRAPRQPIPLPPHTPISIGSPSLPQGEPLYLVSPTGLAFNKRTGDSDSSQRISSPGLNSIYRGLVTDEYPDLLLPPNALPSINVKVASSRLKPSRASILFPKNIEEDHVFTLAVFARSDGRELWRMEKDSASLISLDQTLKQSDTFTAKTPERSLFSGHAPAKVDARRVALDKYLEDILDAQLDLASALEICRYLSTNTMEPYAEDLAPGGDSSSESPVKTGPGGRPLKTGYLTKRGKNFGGWKARYFVLDGPVFKYYESPGGPHLGAIKLQTAQIGKQQQQVDNRSPSRGETDDADNQYRHAFLILEPKRKDSSSLVRHVLCAESDHERDQWVEALLLYVDFKEGEDDGHPSSSRQQLARTDSNNPAQLNGMKPKKKVSAGQGRSQTILDLADDGLRGVSYENTKQGNIPVGSRSKNPDTPSPPTHGNERDPMGQIPLSQSMKNISAPKNAQVIHGSSSWGKKQTLLAPAVDDRIKQKKRSFFGFGSRSRASLDANEGSDVTNLAQMAYEQHGPIRPVFGMPLQKAVQYNHPVDVRIDLPAVVYRCIEYLDAKNAAGEEGIFRLSGSNIVIRQLRERFNVEGDVNLITDGQYYDIHAVASLLKLYLRELPTTILTRELHLEFLAVTELYDVNEKISALNGLVHRLPSANNALLRYLSGFLINIVNNADTNKMTVRNVGIVFSPTLNIPAPVFALFLQQYDGIFGDAIDDHVGNVEVTVTAPPLNPEDIRSPRRQKFQDLPTPSYDQQSFSKSHAPQHYQQQRSNYDTGFTPLQPTYESLGGFPTMAGPEYGRNQQQTLAGPAYDQFARSLGYRQQYGSENPPGSSKSKRRESSMFGSMNIGLGQRNPSSNKLRDDSRLVDEQCCFE